MEKRKVEIRDSCRAETNDRKQADAEFKTTTRVGLAHIDL